MSDALARGEILLSLVEIAQKFELLDEFLICIHIQQNGCASAVLLETSLH